MTVPLPDVDSATFGTYAGWLYTGRIELCIIGNKDGKDPAKKKNWDVELIDAYALGDYLQDLTFKNALCDQMASESGKRNEVPIPKVIGHLWSTASPESKLAKLVVDLTAVNLSAKVFAELASEYPQDFLMKLAIICVEERAMSQAQRKAQNRTKC